MSDSVVTTEVVVKRYGSIVAVNQVSLEVKAGEIYSLVGANGAGKSTLIRMIVGLTDPDEGTVTVCGENLAHRLDSTKRHVGYLPEDLLFYDRLTGAEYLELVAGLKDADPKGNDEHVHFFELAAVQNKLVGGYSLGMRKKLGLAAAFIGEPKVLVLDEPLNGLDVEMMRKLRIKIGEVKDSGRSVLVSSHVMSFVERVSDRIGVMRAGGLIAEGTSAVLRNQTNLPEAPFEDVFFALTG